MSAAASPVAVATHAVSAPATGGAASHKSSSQRKIPSHPPYQEMIKAAILALKERKGSSRQAIKKYILANYKIDQDEKRVSTGINAALKKGTENGIFVRPSGPSGTVKLVKPEKSTEKKESKKKPLATKSENAQKAKAKKPSADKKKSSKKSSKTAVAKTAKKTKTTRKSADATKKKAVAPKKASIKKTSPKKSTSIKKAAKKE